MSKELSPELQAQIEQEAKEYADKKISEYFRNTWLYTEARSGYIAGTSKYALLLQSEQEKRKEAEKVMARMAKAFDAMKEGAESHTIRFIDKALIPYNNYKSKKDGTVNG